MIIRSAFSNINICPRDQGASSYTQYSKCHDYGVVGETFAIEYADSITQLDSSSPLGEI
jgi:hypothetical protein